MSYSEIVQRSKKNGDQNSRSIFDVACSVWPLALSSFEACCFASKTVLLVVVPPSPPRHCGSSTEIQATIPSEDYMWRTSDAFEEKHSSRPLVSWHHEVLDFDDTKNLEDMSYICIYIDILCFYFLGLHIHTNIHIYIYMCRFMYLQICPFRYLFTWFSNSCILYLYFIIFHRVFLYLHVSSAVSIFIDVYKPRYAM